MVSTFLRALIDLLSCCAYCLLTCTAVGDPDQPLVGATVTHTLTMKDAVAGWAQGSTITATVTGTTIKDLKCQLPNDASPTSAIGNDGAATFTFNGTPTSSSQAICAFKVDVTADGVPAITVVSSYKLGAESTKVDMAQVNIGTLAVAAGPKMRATWDIADASQYITSGELSV